MVLTLISSIRYLVLCVVLCSIHQLAHATEFTVLTYNVFMRAPTWVFRDDHDWRARQIPNFLLGYDAVVLQEAFSDSHRADMLAALQSEYPYDSGILDKNELLSQNGGVIILSRWPIIKDDQYVFEACDGSDCLVNKGVKYIEVEKNGVRVHLFGVHLQAQAEYAISRRAQFPQLQYFIERQDVPRDELLLVAGDFNVDYFSDASDQEFSQLTAQSGLVLAEASPSPSYDKRSNTYVEDAVTERLDYVFYSSRNRVPTQASNQVLYFRVEGTDLSDHHAVLGRFELGSGT
jgi:endonuclease/exonuclease/phosphatase family metal-dependent hydrolase